MASGFPYKKILMIGGTSGLGHAWASRFIKEGHATIVVGRRQENLDKFVKDHGSLAFSSKFDITDLQGIPAWAAKMTKEHPDIDCIFLNAGIQKVYDFSKPETLDLDNIEVELKTNYTSYIHLTKAFLPHLFKLGESGVPTSLVGVTSGLGIIPLVRCNNYSATKAALHSFFLALRAQLADAGKKTKIIEIFPPAVQTELHDARHQPQLGTDGTQIGMPLDKFTEDSWTKLQTGQEEVFFEPFLKFWAEDGFETERQKAFQWLHGLQKHIELTF